MAKTAIETACETDGCYVVSEGTLKASEVFPKVLDALSELAPAVYQQLMMPGCGFASVPSYALDDPSDEWWDGEDASAVLEAVVEALNDHAPDGFYFGAHEGDGACFGFFRNEDEGSEA